MYTPSSFALSDAEALAVVRGAGAGVLVTHDADGELDVSVLPFLLRDDRLVGHVARANPVWQHEGPAAVVFTPVDGYVSPAWYASKREHGKVVPTWNYVCVVVHGTLRARPEAAFVRSVVTELTDIHEARVGSDWQVTDAPVDFVERMVGAVVGIELAITRIEGKAKLSQNRPDPDVVGVIDALGGTPLGDAVRAAQDDRPA